MADLRVLIVADNLLARAGLAALLVEHAEVNVVGQVAGSTLLADDLDVYRPDALVWDFGWEPGTAQTHLAELSDDLGALQLPVLALLPDEDRAAEVAALIGTANPGGLLLREAAPEQLAAALDAIAHGLLVFDPLLAVMPTVEPAPEPLAENLTPRELEVLQLLAEGLANKGIAQQLGISDHTVKFHVNAIMTKLNAQSRTDAVVRATRLGLIML